MENVLEKTARKSLENATEYDLDFDADVEYDFEFELELGEGYPAPELDENGEPIGYYTPEEIFDELDQKFVDFYGEEGRRMVNARRERWNRTGRWHYKMF
jgi:hypothetical protein